MHLGKIAARQFPALLGKGKVNKVRNVTPDHHDHNR